MAQLAVANALDGAGRRVSDLLIPQSTSTDPESGPRRDHPAGAAGMAAATKTASSDTPTMPAAEGHFSLLERRLSPSHAW
jgi:hypothetical protein